MRDITDVVKNISEIYDSDVAFTVLKDFERVLDDLDVYVYENWDEGELVHGPKISRHWVTCAFMWEIDKMPDPMGGKRLLDYDCKVFYKKDSITVPRKIRKPDDIRPGTKKGKLDRKPIWVVKIQMPKKNRIVSLKPQIGNCFCALVYDLRGQFGGQIWNLRKILYKISLSQLLRTSLKK